MFSLVYIVFSQGGDYNIIFGKIIHPWFLTLTLNLLRAASLIGRGRICFASGANFKKTNEIVKGGRMV